MDNIIEKINSFIWGLPMIIILIAVHLLMTVKTRAIQRYTWRGIKLSLSRDTSQNGDVSSFQALATSLASTLGTGNIIGLGTAVALGGAGAVFWCWATGILGIATKYAESLIAIKYRTKASDGRLLGGAMYVLENRLNMKLSAKFFAFFTMLSSLLIGCGVQMNAISETVCKAADNMNSSRLEFLGFSVPAIPLYSGLITAIIVCGVIFGGVSSVSKLCERLIPFMTLFYLMGNIIILINNIKFLPESITLIVRSAFTGKSLVGGLTGYSVGTAMRYGISRGLFSNEAGTGSSPIIAAAANCDSPVKQALISSTAVFWDTAVLCLITGLSIVSSIVKHSTADISSGSELTYNAFGEIPYIGKPILIFSLIIFAFSTILGWSYYGECSAEYLFGIRSLSVFRVIYVIIIVVAPLISFDTMWNIADIINALMALPNLLALFMLRNEIRDDTTAGIAEL